MTDEQVQEIIEKLIQEFGDLIPNPEHYPRTFEYYLRMLQYENS